MKLPLMFTAVCLLLCQSIGCGDSSDVPTELRAPEQKVITPEDIPEGAPKGATASESPF